MGGLLSFFTGEENNSEISSPPQRQYATNTHIRTESDPNERIYEHRKRQFECNLRKPEQRQVYAQENRYSSEINTDLLTGCKKLSPSEIHYTQDSIATTFYEKGRHGGVKLGETLDDLLCNRIQIKDIPQITVCWYKQQWFSLDNRRLWVLKNYEKIKGAVQIMVRVTKLVEEDKFTTKNNGKRIFVRGDPGGSYWKIFKINMYQ